MQEHDFYADPTVFDHWHSVVGNWLCARSGRLCPYAWAIAFTSLGAILVVVSLSLLSLTFSDSFLAAVPQWNHALAQGVTAVVSLAAAQALFRQALDAWPRDTRVPAALYRAAGYIGWRPSGTEAHREPGRRTRPSPDAAAQTGRQAQTQAFFAAVRDAGVNVAIARALFVAGIRSSQQLQCASDARLRSIRGVGPATVRKLRRRFNASR